MVVAFVWQLRQLESAAKAEAAPKNATMSMARAELAVFIDTSSR
jgi:hypothetical protein